MSGTERGESKGEILSVKSVVCIVVAYYDSTSTVIVSLSPSIFRWCEYLA